MVLQLGEHVWFVLDVLVTVNLVKALVVLFWSGVWDVCTRVVLPDQHMRRHILCSSLGLGGCVLLLLADPCLVCVHSTCLRRHRCAQVAFEVATNSCAAVCSIMVWVGCWQMLNDRVLPLHACLAPVFHATGVSECTHARATVRTFR